MIVIPLEAKIGRLVELVDKQDLLSRSLLHAYAACFTPGEITDAVIATMKSDQRIRVVILRQLDRLIENNSHAACLTVLARGLLTLKKTCPTLTRSINAILVRLYDNLSPDLKHEIVEVWQSDDRRDSIRCWLNAAERFPDQFDPAMVFRYWQATGDRQAIKLIAFNAPPEYLVSVLPEIVDGCKEDEYWIVSRAAIRSHKSEKIKAHALAAIKEKFGVTYIYVCGRTGTSISHDEALALVRADTWRETGGTRGIVISSIGQLGMWETLDYIRGIARELHKADEKARKKYRASEMRRFGLLDQSISDDQEVTSCD